MSSKRHNGWPDWAQILFGTVHELREGLCRLRVIKRFWFSWEKNYKSAKFLFFYLRENAERIKIEIENWREAPKSLKSYCRKCNTDLLNTYWVKLVYLQCIIVFLMYIGQYVKVITCYKVVFTIKSLRKKKNILKFI